MSRQVKHNIEELRSYINQGMCQESIMHMMGIGDNTTFNYVRCRLMDVDKKYYEIPSRRDAIKNIKPVKIAKNQRIVLGKDILNVCTFGPDDEFIVKIHKDKIVLHRKGDYDLESFGDELCDENMI